MRPSPKPTSGVAVGYVRVSTREQADSGLGLEAQRLVIEDACRARGLELLEHFVDAGVSGGKRSRKGLDAALRALEAPRGLDVGEGSARPTGGRRGGPVQQPSGRYLVVARVDRLARSVPHYGALLDRAERHGWELLALDVPDATSPMGGAMRGVAAVMAELQRKIIGANTRDALAAARARGQQLGRPPLVGHLVVDELVERYRAGASAAAIARQLEADGVPGPTGGRWHPFTVARLIRERLGVAELPRRRARPRRGALRSSRTPRSG